MDSSLHFQRLHSSLLLKITLCLAESDVIVAQQLLFSACTCVLSDVHVIKHYNTHPSKNGGLFTKSKQGGRKS